MKLHIEPETEQRRKMVLLYVTKDDALSLIESLICQLRSNSPNTGRKEYRLDEPKRPPYFSVFVLDEKTYAEVDKLEEEST